jgi:hypothetical protein
MELRMRLRPVIAALAAILAGLTLAASASAIGVGDSHRAMPGGSCPPSC